MLTINSVNVTVTCPICGAESHMVLDYRSFENWMNGELVQNAFPYLDANERELLVSGICSECWSKMFPSEEEEEEDEDDLDYDYDYDYDEVGFNPYMGCYDYDC